MSGKINPSEEEIQIICDAVGVEKLRQNAQARNRRRRSKKKMSAHSHRLRKEHDRSERETVYRTTKGLRRAVRRLFNRLYLERPDSRPSMNPPIGFIKKVHRDLISEMDRVWDQHRRRFGS